MVGFLVTIGCSPKKGLSQWHSCCRVISFTYVTAIVANQADCFVEYLDGPPTKDFINSWLRTPLLNETGRLLG